MEIIVEVIAAALRMILMKKCLLRSSQNKLQNQINQKLTKTKEIAILLILRMSRKVVIMTILNREKKVVFHQKEIL